MSSCGPLHGCEPVLKMQEPNTYPGPLTEVDFWTERAANLNSIHQQLSSERVKKVAKVLELVKSTYYPAFNRLAGRHMCHCASVIAY